MVVETVLADILLSDDVLYSLSVVVRSVSVMRVPESSCCCEKGRGGRGEKLAFRRYKY